VKRLAVLIRLLAPSVPGAPRITRAALEATERTIDQRISKITMDVPFDVLGTARGCYIAGFGAVFTAEVSLAPTPALTPFRQKVTPEEIARIHERKLAQVPRLKQAMREALVSSAAALDRLAPEEQIVVGISLFYYSWEDTSGMPKQVVMRASRKALADFRDKRITGRDLDASIRVEEY